MENTVDTFAFRESEFWLKYSDTKERIETLKRKSVALEKYDPIRICEDIKDILDYDEEENLSFMQNETRKLSAGSELCKELCFLHRHFSKLEINRAVAELLEEEKYEIIANRIDSRKTLEARREKYFLKQALNTIKVSLGNERDEEAEGEITNAAEDEAAALPTASHTDAEHPNFNESSASLSTNFNLTQPEAARASEHQEALRMSKMSAGPRRITEIPIPSEDITIPEVQQIISENEPDLNNELTIQLEDLLRNGWIEPPRDDISGEPEIPFPENEDIILDAESLSDPKITPPKKRRKISTIFDEYIVIPNYRERAEKLNKSIIIERIQVYKGSPFIINKFTLQHVLETPAVNNGLSKTIRSSVLANLYVRHQKTEKKLKADADFPVERSNVENQEPIPMESYRQSLRSESRKSNMFDIEKLQSNIADIIESGIQPDAQRELARLIGSPISRILQPEVMPPQVPIGASDPWLPPRSPRLRNLQGGKIDPPISEPWFKPIQQTPPDDKWRQFEYVKRRLEIIWKENGAEKGATLRQVLEEDWNKANMLTLLRVVDKMSLKREISLDGIGENIVIRPFEIPYVTEKQFNLRFNASKY